MKLLFKIITFSTLAVLVGVSIFFAKGYTFETKNASQTPPMAQGRADGLQLTMTLEKTEYSLGEPVAVTLTITNISNQTRSFGLGPDVNDFDFHVYNDTDSNIYWYSSRWIGGGIPMFVVLETLNSSETLNSTLVWQQTFSHGLGSEGSPVSPGTYYIVGTIGPPFFYGKNSTLETTPIQIALVPQ